MTDLPAPRRIALTFALTIALAGASAGAEERSLSQGWLFHRGEVHDAQRGGADASGWQQVTVPHDFSIADRPDGAPPFDPTAAGGQDTGYLPGGIGWYRHELVLGADDAKRVLQLRFEAASTNAEVWLNGESLGKHAYGYTAFGFDLTGKVRPGRNVIAVRIDHVDLSSRWYAGSGLIRPVTLQLLDPVHIVPDSVFVRTPVASAERGVVEARASVHNRAKAPARIDLLTKVVAPDNTVLAQQRQLATVAAGGKFDASERLTVERPLLWSAGAPNLHRLVQEVRVNGVLRDVRSTRFGIRTVTVDAVNGLRINGEKVVLKGGNIHHDNYMLGASGAPDADARKVALMKQAGYNAIRSAHNPASQATLDAADELGMLVIDEAFDMWRTPKRNADYARVFEANWRQDIDSLVISGRNHPSVLFWSVGNEIPEQGTDKGAETARALVERIRQLDPTRPTTQGVNQDAPRNAQQFAEVDVAGYNYRAHQFGTDHLAHPARVMYSSESTSKDAFPYWQPVETMPWVIGDFVWTAFDYLGETGIGWMGYSLDWQKLGPYPWHLAYSGEIDATGRKRPAAYYRQVLWRTGIDPVAAFVEQPAGTEDLPDRAYYKKKSPADWSLHDVHPSWSWADQEGKPLKVVVYSELPEVELFLNGDSLGRRPVGRATRYQADYQVPYAPGRLVAVGYRDGKPAAEWELRTAGKPAGVRLGADRQRLRANGEDLAYVSAELVDADGTPIYARDGDRPFTVTVTGAGTLAGAGNGNPMDASSLRSGKRATFHGRLVAVVRAGTRAGPIEVEFAADGLPSRRIRLDAVTGR